MAICILFSSASFAQPFVHPGLSHKKSDLDRMKMMVEAGKDPWKSSFASLSQNQYASYNYVVKGSPSNTVINQTVSSEYSKIKFDGLAAYYNALMWSITRDERHAKKAVEIFNAWVNVKRFVSDGTTALNAGRVVWKLLEAAEIIKSTYPGWQQADIDKFKAMLVYPGYSTTEAPAAAIKSSDVTFYWYMYNGDPGRYGNQGIFAMRGLMAMGIFMDNRVMYERALKYLTAQPHRPDDLPYVSGPPIVSTTKAATSNAYYDEYTQVAPYQQTTIPDYGYDDQIQHYIYENGQGQELSRDQAHAVVGVSILNVIAEMAWNQGDDIYGYLDNRLLLGLEYALRYNVSYKYSFADQPSPWEPTVENGEYFSRTARCGRWTSLKINPWNAGDLTRLTRGNTFKSDENPFHEMVLAHYRDRMALPADNYKWTQRAFDISQNEFGYEGQGFEVDNPGYGGLTFRRSNLSPGDPIRSFADGHPVYAMNTLPAVMEAENYDHFRGGGQGRTYYDAGNGNSGGAYRPAEDVDVTTSPGGYAVTNMQPGEWLNYTVAVPKSGFYTIRIRYSSINANGKIRFDFDGVNAVGEVAVPFGEGNSTGADDWKDLVVGVAALQPGVQSMRLYVAGTESAFNLDHITVEPAPVTEAPAAPTGLAAKAGSNQVVLSWAASTGADSYIIKRSTAAGGTYVTVASGVTATGYTNTGLTAGTTYFYTVSAVNAAGSGSGSAEASATPSASASLVEDHFETRYGPVTGSTPENATIGNRVYQVLNTSNVNINTIGNGKAVLNGTIGEAVNIASDGNYTKPGVISISATFDLQSITNNTPLLRVGRGFFVGFWSALPATGEPYSNMRGVFINPEDGELHLWNGSNSSTGTPVQSQPYSGTWVGGSQQHTVSYTINTLTGNIADFVLDGVTYYWNKTNIFSDFNTNYAGFGTSASASTDNFGNIYSFKVWKGNWNEVVRTPQAITFPDIADKKTGDADFDLGASASSGLPLTFVSSNPAIATVSSDGKVHIVGIGKDTITAYQPGNANYEAATAVSRVLTVTNNGSVATRLLIQDNFSVFNAGDSVTGRTPDVATIPGRVCQKAKSVSTDQNPIVNGAARLYNNMGEAISIGTGGTYSKPVYINISDTFDLGTLANNPTPRAARGVYLGFWKSIPTSTSTAFDSYSQFYGIFVNPDGKLQMWNGKNKSDSTPVQTLAYNGTWSGGTNKHTLSYTINTTTGILQDFVLDGKSYSWKDTAIFTAANTNFAGFGVSGAASTQYGNIHHFKVTNVTPLIAQTITFPAIQGKQTGAADFNPRATASSGNPVTYTSSNTAVATIINGLVHIVGEGTAIITAAQAGNPDYLPATATQALTVKRAQTIHFEVLADKFAGDAAFDLTATASSGLPVTYSSSNMAVATIINGNQVQIAGAGTASITAAQAGDDTYAAAPSVTQTLTVRKVEQSITFHEIGEKKMGDADFDPAAVASSGLPVSYSSADESVATVVDGKIHITGTGSVMITAAQAGDGTYAVAASATQILSVAKKEQTITFAALEEKKTGDADFDPAATASSSLPVSYSSSDINVATITADGKIHIVGGGIAIITASQSGNDIYHAASPVSRELIVNIPPVVKTKNIEVAVDENGAVAISAEQVNDGSTSYNGSLTFTLDKSAFNCSDIGAPVTVTLTATDAKGYSGSATAQVTVTDNQAPTVTAPAALFFCFAGSHYTIPGLAASDNCGIQAITYTVTGATSRNGSGTDASGTFAAGVSTITWKVTDIHGNQSTGSTTVTVNTKLEAGIPDVYAMNPAVDRKNTIYLGYGPTSLTIHAIPVGGTAPYSYHWENNATSQSISVSAAGIYTVDITDAAGCTTSAAITISILDVRCGNNNDKVMICHNNKVICVASGAVQEHLEHGDNLGSCSASTLSVGGNVPEEAVYQVTVYPNPVSDNLNIRVNRLQAGATVQVYNTGGALVLSKRLTNTTQTFSIAGWAQGIYYVQIKNGDQLTTEKIIK